MSASLNAGMNQSSEILVDIMSNTAATTSAKIEIDFEEAFLLHHRTVYRAARSIVRESGLAEDVTQETFLKLHKNLSSITNEQMLRPWLIRVAINLAKNTVRGQIRANTREDNYVKTSGALESGSVEADYEEKAGIEDVFRALAQIKEPLRSCLMLKQQGLSYKEIAASLDLNETSIGTFIARARSEFAKIYGQAGKVEKR
ncbi:MAG: sigma-70 family RNA polymerase sigma factor [Chloracidobacterium sp.]|nr:sigma-70 family RNA polymerase sigma factor [Chloracidobacterium sp.]MCO5333608.1 sigma-70 family RNA polymerase sigma factor [Pyrinomonadaceae bacterium]